MTDTIPGVKIHTLKGFKFNVTVRNIIASAERHGKTFTIFNLINDRTVITTRSISFSESCIFLKLSRLFERSYSDMKVFLCSKQIRK